MFNNWYLFNAIFEFENYSFFIFLFSVNLAKKQRSIRNQEKIQLRQETTLIDSYLYATLPHIHIEEKFHTGSLIQDIVF